MAAAKRIRHREECPPAAIRSTDWFGDLVMRGSEDNINSRPFDIA